MTTPSNASAPKVCRCGDCRNKCLKPRPAPGPKKTGWYEVIAKRPWIWIALGYLSFVGVMITFVCIAQSHFDPMPLKEAPAAPVNHVR